jgi:hypothetical protein
MAHCSILRSLLTEYKSTKVSKRQCKCSLVNESLTVYMLQFEAPYRIAHARVVTIQSLIVNIGV